jgi:hypothetical protein
MAAGSRAGNGHGLRTARRGGTLWTAPFALLAILAAGTILAVWAIHAYRYRWVRSNADLIALLPHPPNATVFFANVALLRKAGLLGFLAGARESDYKAFETATGFDYMRDLDTVAGASADISDGRQTYFAVLGRFDAGRIRRYMEAHGGECRSDVCRMPGSKPGSFVSVLFIQPNVLGIAIAPGRSAARQLNPQDHEHSSQPIPSDPLWVQVAPAVLNDPAALPAALRIFAISLQPAESVLVALNSPDSHNERTTFQLQLRALCANSSTADTIRSQLELQTRLLTIDLAREHQTPNAGDLTGLLTAGSFSTSDREVFGNWPVHRALLAALK